MILKKLEELEQLINVPDVNKAPDEAISAMKALNLVVEIRGLVKNLIKPDVSQQRELLVAFLKAYKKVTELSKWNLTFISVFLSRNQ